MVSANSHVNIWFHLSPGKKKTTSPFPNYEKRYRIRYRGNRKHSLHICPVLSLLPVLTILNLPQGNTVNKPFT